jgi:hypothetical protein
MTRAPIASAVALAALLACKGPGNRSEPQPEEIDCLPTTCEAEGKNCGTMVDECGGTLQCGSCAEGETCGAGGANVCAVGSCTPTTCGAELENCGIISDGCAATLECGTCTAPEFCGGSGTKNVCGVDVLAVRTGCSGPFNPGQILDLHLSFAPGDWEALKADSVANALFFPAYFSCGGDPALAFQVGVRRKRSGSIDKPGIKIDFNYYQAGAEWQTLKKLSLENGISEGGSSASVGELVSEYLGWRMMTLSGAHASRSAFVRLFVNGAFVGTYVNVEQVDRRFLRSRLGDDTGWLYKHSGSSGDGYKTNSTIPNPYEDYLCFWDKNPCTAPSAEELATYLPEHLDVVQMLRFGGVNAVIANSDAPFVKDNNFIFYDYAPQPATHRRVYFPWDLDTTMRGTPPIFGGPGMTLYTSILFTHWEDDYDALLTELLAGPLQLSAIEGELDGVVAVVELKGYWRARHPQLTAELEAHAP